MALGDGLLKHSSIAMVRFVAHRLEIDLGVKGESGILTLVKLARILA